MTKILKYKEKYGINWVSKNNGETWSADTMSDAFDSGIWIDVTTNQLNNPKYMQSIAGISKIYWNRYV